MEMLANLGTSLAVVSVLPFLGRQLQGAVLLPDLEQSPKCYCKGYKAALAPHLTRDHGLLPAVLHRFRKSHILLPAQHTSGRNRSAEVHTAAKAFPLAGVHRKNVE